MSNKDPIVCPLTGKPCLIPKVIKVTDVHKGEANTTHLCNLCGSDFIKSQEIPSDEFKEFLDKTKTKQSTEATKAFKGLMDFLDNIIATSTPPGTTPPKIMPASEIPIKDPCPNCGHTLREIIKTERIGCPNCYTHFENELQGVIRTVQSGGVQHVGKESKNWLDKQEDHHTIEKLEKKLEEAIKKEDYETAAQIRDLIKDFKKK